MQSKNKKIIYITRDIERATGGLSVENYFVVANKTPYADNVRSQYPNFVYLIDDSGKTLSTAELLNHPEVKDFISSNKENEILVFKNNIQIERICSENNWHLLNPSALLAEKIENKITQIEWLGELANKYLPRNSIGSIKELKVAAATESIARTVFRDERSEWSGRAVRAGEGAAAQFHKFILQWAHGHTGDGTILIESEEQWQEIKAKFPDRIARLTEYIEGPSFTVNAVVDAQSKQILISNINYQITGLSPFTDNKFSTIGNDWGVVNSLLNTFDIAYAENMIQEIGNKLKQDGWHGLFGIDFIKDQKTNKIFLIEINARQPASTTFESQLQSKERGEGARGLTSFEAHLISLTAPISPTTPTLIKISNGAQILQRVTKNIKDISKEKIAELEKTGFTVIKYQNIEHNADLLRIQSEKEIMGGHKQVNVKIQMTNFK